MPDNLQPKNIMDTLKGFVPGAVKSAGQFLDPANTQAPILGPIRQANFSLFGRPGYADPKLSVGERVTDAADRYSSNFMLHGEPVSPNAYSIHPDDQSVMENFYNHVIVKGNKGGDSGQLGQDAQAIAQHYFGDNWRNVTNETLAKAFAWALDINRKVPVEARNKLPKIQVKK